MVCARVLRPDRRRKGFVGGFSTVSRRSQCNPCMLVSSSRTPNPRKRVLNASVPRSSLRCFSHTRVMALQRTVVVLCACSELARTCLLQIFPVTFFWCVSKSLSLGTVVWGYPRYFEACQVQGTVDRAGTKYQVVLPSLNPATFDRLFNTLQDTYVCLFWILPCR